MFDQEFGLTFYESHGFAVEICVSVVSAQLMAELDSIFMPAYAPFSRVDNVVTIIPAIRFLLRLANRTNSNSHKCVARFSFFVTQPAIIGAEFLQGFGNCIVDFWIVMFMPLPEIFMPLVLQARNNSGPVKPGTAIRTDLRIGKHECGTNQTVRDLCFRKILAGLTGARRNHETHSIW